MIWPPLNHLLDVGTTRSYRSLQADLNTHPALGGLTADGDDDEEPNAEILTYPGSMAMEFVFTNVARRLLPGTAQRPSQRENRCRCEPNGVHLPHELLL